MMRKFDFSTICSGLSTLLSVSLLSSLFSPILSARADDASWVKRDSICSCQGIASSTDGSKLVATVEGGQIYTSSDSGATWTARDSVRLWFWVASSSDGTMLAAVVYGNPGNIYLSSDSGATWSLRASDLNKYWQGIAMPADGSRLLASAYQGSVYISIDYGVTWSTNNSISNSYGVASSADGTRLAATAQGYIYTFGTAATARPDPTMECGCLLK